MTRRPNTLPKESPVASWADVIEQSESLAASEGPSTPTTPASSDFDAASIGPGDMLMHPKFGSCMVHRISEGIIHMAREHGRVIRVRQDMLPIRPLRVETLGNKQTRRVFTTSTEQL